MLKNGVPEDVISLEEKATNAGENVTFGMNVLRGSGYKNESIVIVARSFMMRRAVATFSKQFPDVRIVPSCPPASFAQSIKTDKEKSLKRILSELKRLKEYPELDYISRVKIPQSVRNASALLEKSLNSEKSKK